MKKSHSPLTTTHSLFPILCSLLIAHCSFVPSLFAQEAPSPRTPDSIETVRLNTVKYGTETEIAALIQTLRTEGEDYLDDEIIALVENTRNQRILSGAFSFFGEREKSGLEGRAIRAIEERNEERNETIVAAIDYLGRVKAVNAAPVLQKVIEDGERRFINAAFRAFGRVSGADADGAAEYLIDYYENRSPDDENRREMIVAIGATGSASAVEFLAGVVSDNSARPTLRMAALESISKIGDQSGLEAVLAGVSADDPNVRAAAVAALGPFSGEAVDEAILDAFRDSNFRSRSAAAQASRERRLVAAIPYLKFRAERDEVPAVRDDSIRALGAIADSESVQILEGLFSERKNSDRVRIISGEMIMQIDSGRFLDRFVMELEDAKQKNQTALYNALLRILGGTKGPGMETITRRLMQDRGVVERSYALDMAANNGLTGLSEEIKLITSDRNESLASKARRTLEKLGIQ
ncbi:MAG: HEAT repeat domain-containing protein [Treponema sp.]|nr:HEAT repeat domain-containing protein [Treponema sp.]